MGVRVWGLRLRVEGSGLDVFNDESNCAWAALKRGRTLARSLSLALFLTHSLTLTHTPSLTHTLKRGRAQVFPSDRGDGDHVLPESETCFFIIKLPKVHV